MNFDQPHNTAEQIKYSKIAKEMAEMVERDQAMRFELDRMFKETGKTQLTYEETGIRMEDIDVPNTQRMKEIVLEIGWPTISKVGKQGTQDAWLLVQHADLDPEFQRECLDLMVANISDVSKDKVAYLTDRVELKEDGMQTFGTQWWTNSETGEFEPQPIRNPETVDERRAEYDMDSLDDYKKFFLGRYDDEDK